MIRIGLNLVQNKMLAWGILRNNESTIPRGCGQMLKVTLIAAAALGLLAGCAYHGDHRGTVDNPGVRKVAWFSYLDGGDIRDTCAPGSPDRFRLVYNGQYEK